MFGKSTEKRVAREADKIASLKEDMDAISWARVLEIGKLLQRNVGEADRLALARELVSIAQSNRTLYTRLGMKEASPRIMASGIEVMEGGLAEAAIEKQNEHASSSEEKPRLGVPTVERPVIDAPFLDEPSEIDFQAAEVQVACELASKSDPSEDEFVEAAKPEPIAASTELEAASESELPLQPQTVPSANSADQSSLESESASEPSSHEEPPASETADSSKKRGFARFRNFYESRDGGLCVFEDESGHLVAVDSSKLA